MSARKAGAKHTYLVSIGAPVAVHMVSAHWSTCCAAVGCAVPATALPDAASPRSPPRSPPSSTLVASTHTSAAALNAYSLPSSCLYRCSPCLASQKSTAGGLWRWWVGGASSEGPTAEILYEGPGALTPEAVAGREMLAAAPTDAGGAAAPKNAGGAAAGSVAAAGARAQMRVSASVQYPQQ